MNPQMLALGSLLSLSLKALQTDEWHPAPCLWMDRRGSPPSSTGALSGPRGHHCANYAAGPSRSSAQPFSPSSALQEAASLGDHIPQASLSSHFQLGLANGRYQQARGRRRVRSVISSRIPPGHSISLVFPVLNTSGWRQVAYGFPAWLFFGGLTPC